MTKLKTRKKLDLLNIYNEQLKQNGSEFMKIVLREAITRLCNDSDPYIVENWVIKLELIWRQI